MARPLAPIAALFAVVLTGCTVTDPVGSTTTTLPDDAPQGVVLDAAGLLPFEVGGPIGPVVDGLSDLFGGPDREVPWMRSDESVLGSCPGIEARAFGWGSLYVVEVRDDTGDSFLTWTYGFDHERAESGDPRELGLVTADGIGLGATREDLEGTYPGRVVVIIDDGSGIIGFTIDGVASEHLRGRLTGPGPDAEIDYVERVPGCE
jgi:hypothetical protein